MALLNWGNALSQAGKAMATVGLEGVKSTLEQDKIRLAADLAEQSAERAETRREEADIRAEDRKWTNEQAQQPIRASWVKQAKQDEIDLAADPRNLDKINAAKRSEAIALDETLSDIDKKHADDPLWKAAQRVKYDALNPYAASDAAYRNIMTSAEKFKLDTATSIKDLTSKIAAETDPTKRQALVDEREAKAWSIEGDRAERLASRAERASVGTYIASQQTELARLKQAGALDNDPDVEAIRSSLPGFQSLYKRLTEEAYPDLKVPDPGTAAPAPGAGTGTATPEAPDKRDTLPDGTPITEALSGPGRVLRAVGVNINKAVTAGSERVMDEAIANMAPTYKAAADEINRGIENSTRKGATLPPNYRKNLRVLLSTPAYRGYLSPAAVAVAERFKEQDAAGLSKPGYPAASDEWVTGPGGTKIRKVK